MGFNSVFKGLNKSIKHTTIYKTIKKEINNLCDIGLHGDNFG